MRHQISLVGGQLLPVYVGIKEFNPDKVHFIVSNESKSNISILKPLLTNIPISEYNCNAFDFYSIKAVCERIIEKFNSGDEVSFNLTSGTKIMVLAAQAIIHEKKIKGFYINQDDSLLELPTYEKKQIKTELSIQEFFDLSGHHLFSASNLTDYSSEDFKMARIIESFANNDKRYTSITSHIRKKFNGNNKKVPLKGKEVLTNGIELSWDTNNIKASIKGKNLISLNSKNIIDLFFNAAWWELLVAEEVTKWNKVKEILIKCELPFKTDKQTPKNEIDILLNSGKKLFFVECKSGNVKQEDINKMRVVKQTYGGIISKSILVSRFLPSTTILEKCKELDIEVFYCYAIQKQINPLNKLMSKLNDLDKKGTI
ncbi:MAG: DUF1887 family protein [Cytophagaceae bacterium]|nr:DUF1887 family protein [Cytophagaceae bacterium]